MATRWIDHILGPAAEADRPDPTAAPVGALFQNSDTGDLEINTGSAWDVYRFAVAAGVASIVEGTGISVDDTDPANPVVSTTGGGGGGGSVGAVDNVVPAYLASANLDPTYGDAFTGTSLNARWTRHTVASGNETWQTVNGSEGVRWGSTVASGWLYLQSAPAGDFQIHATIAVLSGSTTTLCGPLIVDSSGTGIALGTRQTGVAGFNVVNVGGYAYSSYGGAISQALGYSQQIYSMSIKKVGTTYTFAAQPPDTLMVGWNTVPQWQVSTTWAGTVDRIGVGALFSDAPFTALNILRFNLTTGL